MEKFSIRSARLNDVTAIHALVNKFATRQVMLPLSFGDITERLRDFLLVERDGQLLGTVAVHVTWDTLVEIRSLAVLEESQGEGLGRRLIAAALDEARRLGATEVFTLTYVPEFFEKYGFQRVERSVLPHKVWQDCTKCPKFPDCGETALKLTL